MNFGVNTLQNHHLQPRNRLDLIMMEPPEAEEEAGGGSNSGSGSGGRGGEVVEREHMFDKVVTPSDVGKLNRLVIPKQHAERFFPLDSSTNDKGLLLNFEDRNGKSWRFRYSYWNSSQSYVMTKGWSRFVKEKRLDAGDIVSFQRGIGEIGRDRLYIDWRRRPELPLHHYPITTTTTAIRPSIVIPSGSGATAAWGPLVWQPLGVTTAGYHHQPAAVTPRDHTHLPRNNNNSNNNNGNGMCCPYGYGSSGVETTSSGLVYLRTELGGKSSRRVIGTPRLGEDQELELEMDRNFNNYQMQQEYCSNGGGGASMVVLQGNYSMENHHHHHQKLNNNNNNNYSEEDTPVKKSRLRLFGVNMEMESPISSPSSDECDLLLSTNPKTTTSTTQFQLPSPSIYKV
ncbi:uncharacterized protein LOC103482885 [Cucumis melo]|uniref:Uncharacterized protein LOC103482885 n=2 Tax=Cucumis melo TaxID=3656 RepID=A0A1S3AU44_CUCME|nr:uncharacterized protein LOC103482885 [Cucumis melo]